MINKRTFSSSGFTLIELLVVIAIIGILASVVLSSLASARTSARDSAIKQQMSSLVSQAELFRLSNGGSYGPDYADDSIIECTTANRTTLLTGVFGSTAVVDLTEAIYAQGPGGRVFCVVRSGSWAFAAGINNPTGSNTAWCVDNSGTKKEININLISGGAGSLISAGVARCP